MLEDINPHSPLWGGVLPVATHDLVSAQLLPSGSLPDDYPPPPPPKLQIEGALDGTSFPSHASRLQIQVLPDETPLPPPPTK